MRQEEVVGFLAKGSACACAIEVTILMQHFYPSLCTYACASVCSAFSFLLVFIMAPHLAGAELDLVTQAVAKGKEASEILALVVAGRRKSKTPPPKIWAIRRAMLGSTHKRGLVETRGRKRRLSQVQVNRLFTKRAEMIKKSQASLKPRYVSYDMVKKAARVPCVDDTTVARHLGSAYGVAWRRLREKPERSEVHEEQRKEVCKSWRRRPKKFFTHDVDLIIDCKKFPVPGNRFAARRLGRQRIRGALRTKGEGIKKQFLKPSVVKHKFNPGGHVHILAGICNDKVVLWEEITGRWNAKCAEAMYNGPIRKVLKKRRPGKKSWRIMEDNDPAGFKSSLGRLAKKANKIKELNQPPYSPDLNPLDFSIWAKIQAKALEGRRANETKQRYKARLRQIALRLPKPSVKEAVESIRGRAKAIFEADGQDIKRD